MKLDLPPEPWNSFLRELDETLEQSVVLQCFGGFPLAMRFGLPRPTFDVDCFTVTPVDEIANLELHAGLRSPLYRKYQRYIQYVGIANAPEDYDLRLTEMFPGVYRHLQLFSLDPHDIVLAKLERNSAEDRHDVEYLGRVVPLDPKLLVDRYHRELRPYLANEARHDLTLRLWLEMLQDQAAQPDLG